LTRPQNLKQMVDYIATEEFFKFSKMASISCDVLCSNSITFVETLIAAYSLRDFADSDEEDEDDEPDSDSDVSDDNNNVNDDSDTARRETDADNQPDETAANNNQSSLSPQRSRGDSPGTSLSQQPTRPFVASSPFSPSSRVASTTALASPRQHLLEALWGVMQLSAGQLDALQATYFSRVMCSLLQRKPYETLDFIRAQGNVVSRFLEHLSVSAVVDLLLKIISLEELEGGPGIIAWLSEDRLIPMLVDRLAPDCEPEMHSLAAQVLLDIIAISQCNNPAQPTIGTNALIEELKSQETVTRLADYMLDRTAPHATSTLVNCVYIFIELIRRNYSEGEADMSPEDQSNGYGFGGSYDGSSYEQQAPRKLPTVDLSDMMRVLALRTRDMVELLRNPRSSTQPVPTTLGLREPLGFERLRICELFAELLHCSNMPRLNVSVEQAVGEALASVEPAGGDMSKSAEDLPTHKDSPTVVGFTPRQQGSPGNSSGSSPHNLQQAFSPGSAKSNTSSNSSSNNSSANFRQAVQQGSAGAESEASDGSGFSGIPLEIGSPSEHDTSNTPVGQLLKWNFIQHSVLPICTDLFFQFSLNNFLHSVVYDIMHQVLNLPLNLECNLALIVVAFRDVRITSRIAQACAQNDQVSREPRGTRLGYMGHLTGIGEEVARLLELSGAALEPLIAPYIDGDEWLDYVARTLQEVRERDQQPLGGERPGGQGGSDIMSGDNAAQVFVSRMGLVDPSSNESYGAEDDDDDIDEDMDDEDDDDMDEDDDDEVGRFSRRAQGKGFGRSQKQQQQQSGGMLYPNNDEDETSAEYMATHQNMYFGRGQFDMVDDSDQFIIKDEDDDDDDVGISKEHGDDGGDGIGPAGRIGRFRSYQNEQTVGGYSQGGDDDDDDVVEVSSAPKTVQGSAMDEDSSDGGSGSAKAGKDSRDADEDDDDEDDEDGATEVGRMRDYMRNRDADIAEATRQKSLSPPSSAGAKLDDQGKGGRLLFSDCVDDGADYGLLNSQQPSAAAANLDGSKKERRQLVRLSFDGSAHTVATVDHSDSASLPSYLLALPSAASSSSSSSCSFPSVGESSSSCTFTFSSPVDAAASNSASAALVSLPTPPQSKMASTTFPSVNGVDDDATTANTAVVVNGNSQKIPLPPVPKIPPHPFAGAISSMPPPPPIPTHPFAPQSQQQQQQPPPVPKPRPKNPFVEPKGRVKDLYRESKQRSHSSSELDSIVPADIGSWTADGASSSSKAPQSSLTNGSKPDQQPADDPDVDGASARRGRAGSFAARRQRSRSQSAGVGITREMVIQAASLGQFPYLDAKTCEFVGQLKSDTVTLGGAAAGGNRDSSSSTSRQRSKTAAGS
ncbi:sporulation-induced protein, partial [Coemansia sp. RSA 2603]